MCRAWHEASRVRVPVPGSSRAEGQPKGKCVIARRGASASQGEIAGRRTETGYEAEPGHKQFSGLFVPGEGLSRWLGAACKANAFGTSGHVTAKSSICTDGTTTGWGAFCKSGVYARKVSCLTAGDLPCCRGVERRGTTGGRATGFERRAEVSRGRSRKGEGAEPRKPDEGPNGAPRGA